MTWRDGVWNRYLESYRNNGGIQAVYPLTLVQKMELFRIAMGGIEKLDSFR